MLRLSPGEAQLPFEPAAKEPFDRKKAAHWISALRDVDRRIASVGGNYLPMEQLRVSAEAGDAEAQYRLGVQLLESYSRDAHAEAVEWWIRAADLGHHEAQYRLVSYYNHGDRFVEKDHRRVVELLEQATAGKHPQAMLALALAHEKGRYGLARDLGSARDLYAEIVAAGENDLYGWEL